MMGKWFNANEGHVLDCYHIAGDFRAIGMFCHRLRHTPNDVPAQLPPDIEENSTRMAIMSIRYTANTGGDDQYLDTGEFVRVLKADQQMLIASIDNAGNCNQCHYDGHTTPFSNPNIDTPVLTPGIYHRVCIRRFESKW